MEKPVVFRRSPVGEIIAVFPTLPGDSGGDSCTAYTANKKKHSIELTDLRTTTQAGVLESLPLLQELVHSGFYPLKPVQRVLNYMNEARLKALSGKPAPAANDKTTVAKPAAVKHQRKRVNRWKEQAA